MSSSLRRGNRGLKSAQGYHRKVVEGKMKLTKKEVIHIANLAKLTLTTQEIKIFGEQLSEVVNYVSELNQVDTRSVKPTGQTTGLTNVFRQDTDIAPSLKKEEALSGTEVTHNNYFLVPQIISKNA